MSHESSDTNSSHIHTRFFDPNQDMEMIHELEHAIFAEKAFDRTTFEEMLNDPAAIVILLLENDRVIGYTCARPDHDDATGKTCYVESTGILPEYQGKKLVATLLHQLEGEMKQRTFTHITRDAMIDNGWADKLSRAYDGRIESQEDLYDPHGLGYGWQRHFRIRLNETVNPD